MPPAVISAHNILLYLFIPCWSIICLCRAKKNEFYDDATVLRVHIILLLHIYLLYIDDEEEVLFGPNIYIILYEIYVNTYSLSSHQCNTIWTYKFYK